MSLDKTMRRVCLLVRGGRAFSSLNKTNDEMTRISSYKLYQICKSSRNVEWYACSAYDTKNNCTEHGLKTSHITRYVYVSFLRSS